MVCYSRVLLVEDDEDDYFIIKKMLSQVVSCHFQLDWVDTYESALEVIRKARHDVILLDYILGEHSGLDLLRELMSSGCPTPVILLTGFAAHRVDIEAMQAGAADYLVKSQLSADLLDRSIRYAVQRTGAQSELIHYRDHLEDLVEQRTAELQERSAQLETLNSELHRQIGERQRAEEALRESEKEYRSLFESSLDIVYIILADGTVSSLNPAFESVTGWPPEEWLGKKFFALIHPDDMPGVRKRFKRILEGETIPGSEVRVLSKSGAYRVLELKSVPRVVAGKVAGVLGTATDVTARKLAEAGVREQKEFLLKVLESLSHPFYVLDAQTYAIQIANSAAAPSGLPPGVTCHQLTHKRDKPCDGSRHVCPLQTIRETKQPLITEHIHYDAEGNPRNVEVHGYPILDARGNVVQIIEYTLDITARKRAEEALHRREQEYRALVENSPDVILRLDRELRRVYANKALEVTTGYPLSTFIGSTIYEPARQDRFEYVALMEVACKKVLADGKEEAIEFPYLTTRGLRHFHMRIVPEYSNEGRIETLLTISRDVTELRQIQEELQRARDGLDLRVRERTAELARANEALRLDESRLEALFSLGHLADASTERIAKFTLDQQIKLTRSGVGAIALLSSDETFFTLHACSAGLMENENGKTEPVAYPVEKSGLIAEVLEQRKPIVRNAGAETAGDLKEEICPHIRIPISRFMVAPVLDGEQIVAIALVANKDEQYDSSDVRQLTLLLDGMWKLIRRGRAEEALREAESLAAMGRALSGVAHDIKTPLVAVGGFTKIVHGHLDEGSEDRAKLDIVIGEVRRLEAMLHQILDFSKPLEIEASPGDLNRIIRESLLLVEGPAKERQVRIDTQLGDLPALSIDAGRMKQVFINLFLNAIQASPPGGAVTVRTRRKGERVLVDVSDSGEGVPAGKKGQIFLPFVSTKKEGTGLGLPIVKKIVDAHKGRVEVLDNPDAGVTFRIDLPLAD